MIKAIAKVKPRPAKSLSSAPDGLHRQGTSPFGSRMIDTPTFKTKLVAWGAKLSPPIVRKTKLIRRLQCKDVSPNPPRTTGEHEHADDVNQGHPDRNNFTESLHRIRKQ